MHLGSAFKQVIIILSLGLVIFPPLKTQAQEAAPDGPVYTVQQGDTLWSIAQRFRVSVEDLQNTNDLANPNQLTAGLKLIIPGLEGIKGNLTTTTINYGDTLRSLSRRYRISPEAIAKLNHMVSPMELYAGSTLVIPEEENPISYAGRLQLSSNQTILELSVQNDINPWAMLQENNLSTSWTIIPGETLYSSNSNLAGPGGLPVNIASVEIQPQFPLQGKTTIIRIQATESITVTGSFVSHDLHFFPESDTEYVALQGIHALIEPGIYPLRLDFETSDGRKYSFSQMVNIQPVDYPYDRPLTVDKATIDPAVTKPEDEKWLGLAANATPDRMWDQSFAMPSPLPLDYCLKSGDCWSSRFGNRRSYNGSAYTYFHTGLDIFGGTGTKIFAPADGVVVFAGPLTIRGNATLIDHGWGVYTGYMHQSEIYVKVGDRVTTGQVIGLVGGTGRVEGPHLHWEVLVGGVQVDPLDWLSQAYP